MLLDASGHPLPPTPTTRRFDGAAGGVRWQNAPSFGSINPEVLNAATPLRRRATYFARNNAWLANGITALVTAMVGTGIRPVSQHPDAPVRKALQAAFARWAAQADADGVTDLYGLQSIAARTMIEQGECFAAMSNAPAIGIPLRIRLIDPEMIDVAHTTELGGGARVVGGIEFDAEGTRTAYHVLRRRPTDLFAGFGAPVRIPAADMAHLFHPLAPGQVRGIPWTANALLRLNEIDQMEDAQLVRQKVAAMFAGFLVDNAASAAGGVPYEGTQVGSIMTSGLEPGTLKILPAGMDIKFATPAEATEGIPFMKVQLRAVAAGLGVPDYLLSGDLTGVNYSSIRAGLVEFRRRVEALQYHVVVHQLLRPIWQRFILTGVLSGRIEAHDFESRPEDYLDAEWYPPAADWVDPLKDAQAEATAIAAGLKSRRQAVAERGYDVEQLDAEIAADRAREASLNLNFIGPQNAQEPNNDD